MAAMDVCSAKEVEVLDALLAEGLNVRRAAARIGVSQTTLADQKAAFGKIEEHEAVINAKLPTRRATAPAAPTGGTDL